MTVTLSDVRAAAAALAGSIVATPCTLSRTLSELTGARVTIKFENLQFTASFKERGALVKLKNLTATAAQRGVIAVSAGNHAQGVAYHAERLGIPATIVMPRDTAFTKVRHTKGFGAEVALEGATLRDAASHALALAESRGLTLVHPYDDAQVIAGQGTVALEMLAEHPGLEALVVPVGGGGLIAGCAITAKGLSPDIEVIGVEARLYPTLYNARNATELPMGGPTIADGIAVEVPGELTRRLIEAHVDDIVLVTEEHLERAVGLYLEVEKTVAEGAGAAGLAALLSEPGRFSGREVGLILSGGNIDPRLLASVIMRGLVRDGRIVRVRVESSDTPGTLALVASVIGDSGGNIIEVYHQRLFSDVPVKSADLDLVVETRDPAHVDDIMARLAAAGFAARLLSTLAATGRSPVAETMRTL